MAVKLIDLQLIYGVAGARDKFEDLASQLVEGEQPDADKVRIEQGDAGIDVYVGDFTDAAGIEIYQCKFFPLGLDDTQKEQIRKSYRTCRDTKKYKAKRWTLCLPVDLSIEEKKWFGEWRSKQAADGIVIEDPWGAMKLEGLLYQSKNAGLKEAFFKEEHLSQIREMHTMLSSLVTDITKRLLGNEESTLRSQKRAQRDQVLAELVRISRDHYVKHSPVSEVTGKQPNYWEVVIRPTEASDDEIDTLKKCWEIVQASQVRSHGWVYPEVPYQRESGSEWVGATHPLHKPSLEVWRMSQQGEFVHLFPIFDDTQNAQPDVMHLGRASPDGFIPKQFFDIDAAVRMVTHVFRFAANLLEHDDYPFDGGVEVTIRITGTKNRVLAANDTRRLRDHYRAMTSPLTKTWKCDVEELQVDPDGMAVKAGVWLFERFNMHDSAEEAVKAIQSYIFTQFPRRRGK